MKINKQNINGKDILFVNSDQVILNTPQDAVDLIMTAIYEHNCERIALNKSAVAEDFFKLSSGAAGEILQKFTTYQTKLAIIGDYSQYTSKPLKDFIYESNKGNAIFFVADETQAGDKLSGMA